MTPVFLDTVGLIALWDQADQWHAAADAAMADLIASNCHIHQRRAFPSRRILDVVLNDPGTGKPASGGVT